MRKMQLMYKQLLKYKYILYYKLENKKALYINGFIIKM